jgi:hypothetical protein
MDLSTIAQLLGLGGPVAATLFIYLIFKFLDSKASQAANHTMVTWIADRYQKPIDVHHVIIAAFDQLYGSPLLSLKTLLRTAVLSTCSTTIYYLFLIDVVEYQPFTHPFDDITVIPFVIISDYISLFVVKRALIVARINFQLSVLIILFGAALAIMLCVLISEIVSYVQIAVNDGVRHHSLRFALQVFWIFMSGVVPDALHVIVPLATSVGAAAIIYVWFPILILGLALTRAAKLFIGTVKFAQWFVKRGERHPFEAIGISASAATFLIAICIKIALWAA